MKKKDHKKEKRTRNWIGTLNNPPADWQGVLREWWEEEKLKGLVG